MGLTHETQSLTAIDPHAAYDLLDSTRHLSSPGSVSNIMPYPQHPGTTLSQIYWILQINPQLEDVTLSHVAIRDKHLIHNLAYLTQLVLHLFIGSTELKSMILFCLPPSLQNVKLVAVHFCTGQVPNVIKIYLTGPLEFRSWDYHSAGTSFRVSKVGDILRNLTPLTHLTELKIWDIMEDALVLNEIRCLFKQCPRIRPQKLALLHYELDAYAISRITATTCQG